MDILAFTIISAAVSFIVARCYVVWAMEKTEKTFSEAVEKKEKTSHNFMVQVKNENDLFVKEVLSRTGKL